MSAICNFDNTILQSSAEERSKGSTEEQKKRGDRVSIRLNALSKQTTHGITKKNEKKEKKRRRSNDRPTDQTDQTDRANSQIHCVNICWGA